MKEGSAAAETAADGTREGDRRGFQSDSPTLFMSADKILYRGEQVNSIPFAQGERGIFFLIWENYSSKKQDF